MSKQMKLASIVIVGSMACYGGLVLGKTIAANFIIPLVFQ